ncbi:MAG: enoyl-CoA hydratase-related protein [Gemmatimonadota bacterium]
MSYELLAFDIADRIATITVNRPDKLNALNDALMLELGRAVMEARRDPAVGAILLTGAGRAFVAGADIGELVDQSATAGKARAERGQRTFRLFETSPKPTLAAVNGFALGGGCELAMACHIRIASEKAKFGQPEVKLGIVPGYGGTQRLPRLVGKGRALQLLLTGEMIDAAEAYRIGLVNRVVAPEELITASRTLLATMLEQGPLAIAHCIEAVDRGLDMGLDDAIALEASHFGLLSATEDKAEGMRAFLEKRAAVFKGK